MGMGMRQEMRHLMVTGGATDSIFPAVDSLLNEPDIQKGLEFVASKKDMHRYHSMVDFLFCEIFIEHRDACFRFYDDKGKALRFLINDEQRVRYEWALIASLKLANDWWKAKLVESWTKFRVEALRLAA